jgi:hypothetical protein
VPPRSLASRTHRETMGWFSAKLEPMTSRQSDWAKSVMGFVIAPEPKVVTRPVTVGLCQRRAQWSTLFVPSIRASFWNR